MKKLITLLLCIATINGYAALGYCGYKDYFRLDESVDKSIHIITGNSDGDLLAEWISPRSFILRDYSCNPGFAHVTVAADDYHWCILDIYDGPYLLHPKIRATCSGLTYINTTYLGANSYSIFIN